MRPIELPETAPAKARAVAAEYALGLTDVAKMLHMTRQGVYLWARNGRRTDKGEVVHLRHIQEQRGHRQSPLRFRLRDVLDFATQHHLVVSYEKLSLELQHRLQVGPYAPDAAFESLDQYAHVTISESEAARQFGVARALLWKRRTAGRVNPGIRLSLSPDGGAQYCQIDVIAAIEGGYPLFVDAEDVPPAAVPEIPQPVDEPVEGGA